MNPSSWTRYRLLSPPTFDQSPSLSPPEPTDYPNITALRNDYESDSDGDVQIDSNPFTSYSDDDLLNDDDAIMECDDDTLSECQSSESTIESQYVQSSQLSWLEHAAAHVIRAAEATAARARRCGMSAPSAGSRRCRECAAALRHRLARRRSSGQRAI